MLRMLTNEIIPESIKVQVSGNEVPVTNWIIYNIDSELTGQRSREQRNYWY
jgi:hypothetical protein